MDESVPRSLSIETPSDVTLGSPGGAGTSSLLLDTFRVIVQQFGIYFTMVIMFSGIFGNVLSVVVFWRLRHRDKVTATYLAPIAVYDLTVLCIGLSGWLDQATYAFSNGAFFVPESYTDGHCKFRQFLFFSCGMMSGWTLIVFCTERCVAIRSPLKVTTIFTPSRRRNALILVIIFSFIFGTFPIPTFITAPSEGLSGGMICRPAPSTTWELALMITTGVGFYTAFPVILLIVLNVLLLKGLKKSQKSLDDSRHGNTQKKTDAKILRNLLLVSSIYIVTMLPVAVLATVAEVGEMTGWPQTPKTYVQFIRELQDFATTFHYANYSANYIVYVLSLDFYRSECRRLFCCGRSAR
jgi:hypothetical protein